MLKKNRKLTEAEIKNRRLFWIEEILRHYNESDKIFDCEFFASHLMKDYNISKDEAMGLIKEGKQKAGWLINEQH